MNLKPLSSERLKISLLLRRGVCTDSRRSRDLEEYYVQRKVFKAKPSSELLRTFVVLKASSFETLVKYSEQLFLVGQKWFLKPFLNPFLNLTFYRQFAAGVDVEKARDAIDKLKDAGIKSMLCVPMETKEYSCENEAEEGYEANFNLMMKCIEGADVVDVNGFAQLKITPLCDKELLREMNKHLETFQLTHQEPEAWGIKTMSRLLQTQRYEDVKIPELSDASNKKLSKLLCYLDSLAQKAVEMNVRLMLDAEQTFIQAALNYIVLLLQSKHNKESPVVYNTYQCYRKDTLNRIAADHKLAESLGFKLAGKLVRGAYMVEERRLALENNSPDPINDTFDDTTAMYHAVVEYLLPVIAVNQAAFMIASHNEATVEFVKSRMNDFAIDKNDPYLCFAQLYGMCDHVSYHLGEQGFQTFKSVPYGDMNDTLLYLSRRAHENRSVLTRTAFEMMLIKKELRRRMAIG